jgi:hypothetical protein
MFEDAFASSAAKSLPPLSQRSLNPAPELGRPSQAKRPVHLIGLYRSKTTLFTILLLMHDIDEAIE